MEERCQCSMCLREVDKEDLFEFDGEFLCHSCLEEETTTCDRCGERIWRDDAEGDSDYTLCSACYDHYYDRCECCGRIVHRDEAYTYGDDTYCEVCYHQKQGSINDYSYKPEPIFYGDGDRFLGVELEIDGAGEIGSNAKTLLEIANRYDNHMYCKHDGSLDDGLELVTQELSEKLSKEDMDSVMALRELLFQAQDIELESQFAFGFAAGMILQWEAHDVLQKGNVKSYAQIL